MERIEHLKAVIKQIGVQKAGDLIADIMVVEQDKERKEILSALLSIINEIQFGPEVPPTR